MGRNETVVVYEPLDQATNARVIQNLSVYEDARLHLEAQDLDSAEELFSRLPEDPVSRAYLSRIRGYRQSGGTFTHIWTQTEK